MYDLLIRNGTVIDGSGRPMVRADVAIKEGVIGKVGDGRSEAAERVIDASGLYVCPGFIDVNNHSDTYWELFRTPGLPGMLYQGVTTIVGGNSGASLAPLIDSDTIRAIQKWTDVERISFNWLTMKEFLVETERRRIGPNFATLVGHGTIRRGILKVPTRKPTAEDVAQMIRMLDTALDEGAIGLSSGLRYTHARLAEQSEIVEMLRVVSKAKGVYATYLRDEGENLLKAVEEAIATADAAKIRLHVSHLKAIGRRNWSLMKEALSLMRAAAQNGTDISFDVYPYTTSGSVLYTFLPEWVTESGRKAMLHRLRDSQVRAAVIRDMQQSGYDYSQMTIASSTLSKVVTHRTIQELAVSQTQTPEETVLDVLLASDGRAIVTLEVSSPENVMMAVQHPFSIISSNGVGYDAEHEKTGERVHPRNFGTFPKVFAEYVRDRKALSWEEAVHKMTGKPAERFNIDRRGLIREKHMADIVLVDPSAVRDRATMENPYQYPDGIPLVIVNGKVVIEEGEWNGTRAGAVIRRHRKGFFSW